MITLYTHHKGPNGWKVVMVLEELGLKYESKYLEFGTEENGIKGPEHLKVNPNGRIPSIIDHDNGDFALWESTTIIRYLVERYDTTYKLSYPRGSKESYTMDQWLTFQSSGQGPYFGQVPWFRIYHPEKLPSAVERYQKEIIRIISVLDGVLAKQSYLVGDKLTVADLSFHIWNSFLFSPPGLLDGSPLKEELDQFKHFKRWHDEMLARPIVKKVYATRNAA